ncbi:Tn3 family transposase [Streptomyces cirratus]|uniref:Tn3 family transposase n=1 Tax=Streptomyces cirratus TaxID=68187 RepID=UPI0036095AB2
MSAASGLLVGRQGDIDLACDWGGGHVASDARLWRLDMSKDYGPLQAVSRQRVQVERIRQNWEDMLRVAGSLQTGKVRAYDLLRMMTSGDRMTGLGDALAHYGRIFKTLHLLQFIDSEAYRRMIGVQLNIGEDHHALARSIFFGRLGELRHPYRGMEDQLGTLGMALNAVVWWNTLYMDAAVKELPGRRADHLTGDPIPPLSAGP